MQSRISEYWDKIIHRPGRLGVGVAVWAVMLGGVFATVQLNTTHVAADRSYVEHEPEVAASIRQKSIGPAKPVASTPDVEAASAQMPQHPHEVMPTLQARNIPVPATRPDMPSIKALPLLATRDIPVPQIGRDQACSVACDQIAMNAGMSAEEASKLPFDESPVLEGPVEREIPIVSDLKHLASAAIRPLDMLKPLAQSF
jgi:hypothetical protein